MDFLFDTPLSEERGALRKFSQSLLINCSDSVFISGAAAK